MPRLVSTSILLSIVLISTSATAQEPVENDAHPLGGHADRPSQMHAESVSANTTVNDPLAEKRAAARKAREEARAQWLKVYEEQAAKEAAERAEYEAKLKTQPVTIGSIIMLKHVETQRLLAGTNFKYFHRHSSGQHQIIAAASEDGYSHWRVLPKVTVRIARDFSLIVTISSQIGTRWETLKDVPVNHGDTIRLLNMRTQRCLHSHRCARPLLHAAGRPLPDSTAHMLRSSSEPSVEARSTRARALRAIARPAAALIRRRGARPFRSFPRRRLAGPRIARACDGARRGATASRIPRRRHDRAVALVPPGHPASHMIRQRGLRAVARPRSPLPSRGPRRPGRSGQAPPVSGTDEAAARACSNIDIWIHKSV